MKKNIFIFVFILSTIILIGFYYFKIRRNAYSVANLYTGFKIDKKYKVEIFKDKWGLNGDGESLIVFYVLPEQQLELQNKCIKHNYNKLPIKEYLPDNVIFNFLNKNDSSGYYLLNIDYKDDRNYSIVIFSLIEKKLIVYNTVY